MGTIQNNINSKKQSLETEMPIDSTYLESMIMEKLLTEDEKLQICYIPRIISQLAIQYAEETIMKGAKYKINMLKGLSKNVKNILMSYERFISQDLDKKKRNVIVDDAKRLVDENQKHFQMLYFSANNEFKKVFPSLPYDDMRTLAMVSMLLIKLLDIQNKKIDSIIARKLGKKDPYLRIREIDKLYFYMSGYVGTTKGLDFHEKNIETGMKIIYNIINNFTYSV